KIIGKIAIKQKTMDEKHENSNDTPSLDDSIRVKELEIKKMRDEMAEMRKGIKQAHKKAQKSNKILKQIRKEQNAARKKFWQLLFETGKNQKDIALDGISGCLNQN
ncbi:MAG TPA: hypothetical protein VKR58_13685, partial [Aquella sp.]|nr:hypothetical protein [Aquella sp.]